MEVRLPGTQGRTRAPSRRGYIHIGARVCPRPKGRSDAIAAIRGAALALGSSLDVGRVAVFDAVAMPPADEGSSDLGSQESPRFDVVVLIETTSPEAVPDVRAAPAYGALIDVLQAVADATHVVAAREIKRLGAVDRTRAGLFLFTYFVADDAELMLRLWDNLAGWYETELGLDNAALLVPLAGETSDFVAIDSARWDRSLPGFLGRQLAGVANVRANLEHNHAAALPVLYRLT